MLKDRPRVITRLLNNFRHNVQASILMMSAILMPVIIGMAGLGLDASHWMMTQRMLQNSVDAAVLAAAWETAHGMSDGMQDAAEREAANNGWDSTKDGTLVLSVDTNSDGEPEITGVLRQKADVFLSRMIHGSDIYIATTAAATLIGPTGDFCVLALNNAASGAITFTGNAGVNSAGCGIAINSNSSTALSVGGSSDVAVNDVSIVGGSSATCGSSHLSCNSMATNSGYIPDPYANLEPSPYTPCTAAQINSHAFIGPSSCGAYTYCPGTYCGGLSSSGNGTRTFAPGVYTLDSGSLGLGGNGSYTGQNVAFVLTTSTGDNSQIGTLDQHGGADISFTAPAEGSDMAGMVIYQDRNAPSDSGGGCSNTVNGNGKFDINGAIYFPSQCLHLLGNRSTTTTTCSRMIADTIVWQGNFNLGSGCGATSVQNIGQYTVKLSM